MRSALAQVRGRISEDFGEQQQRRREVLALYRWTGDGTGLALWWLLTYRLVSICWQTLGMTLTVGDDGYICNGIYAIGGPGLEFERIKKCKNPFLWFIFPAILDNIGMYVWFSFSLDLWGGFCLASNKDTMSESVEWVVGCGYSFLSLSLSLTVSSFFCLTMEIPLYSKDVRYSMGCLLIDHYNITGGSYK